MNLQCRSENSSAIAIWATPRSVSTAFAKSLSLLDNTMVLHEPFSDPYHFGPDRRSSRYDSDSSVRSAQSGRDVSAGLVGLAAGLSASGLNSALVVKDLAFQAVSYVDLGFLQTWRHVFLLRRPDIAYASLVRLKPDFNREEFGYSPLLTMVELVSSGLSVNRPYVIDGSDLQDHPEETLRRFCADLELAYDPKITRWDTGALRSWKEHEHHSQAIWHKSLEDSHGFKKRMRQDVDIAPKAEHRYAYDEAWRIYNYLASISTMNSEDNVAAAVG